MISPYPHKGVLNPDAGSGVPDFPGRFPSLDRAIHLRRATIDRSTVGSVAGVGWGKLTKSHIAMVAMV